MYSPTGSPVANKLNALLFASDARDGCFSLVDLNGLNEILLLLEE